MGVLLEGFFFAPGINRGAPSPLDGDQRIPFWWDHLAAQAQDFRRAGFSAVWIPQPLKCSSGGFSNGYDVFDDHDLGSKDQRGTIPTRYGHREQLERCVAMMRANGLDVYVDLVENQRDGDNGDFHFEYVDAFGQAGKGRFVKGPGDFHPNVPRDPDTFSDIFSFGRDLAPINGVPKDHCRNGLLNAADWLTRALDVQGFRLDNTKSVSTIFMLELLHHGALANKFAVGEFADSNVTLIENWANAMQHRATSFDFPLHFALKDMCNNPDGFNMASLDHAGLVGVDPLGAVTFVENHDTDQGGIGGPIVKNKLLAYAYILTAEGYPCVFYRDYSKDRHCFGLKDSIDRLIWIHENLAAGETLQRWKDNGVFAFERLGGGHLLVGLNKDAQTARTIMVQTGFPPHTHLQDFAEHAGQAMTDAQSAVTITIPRNEDGKGYVCYARPAHVGAFQAHTIATTQVYEGARDVDIKPAVENDRMRVCRVFVQANTTIHAHFFFDASHWTPTTAIQLEIEDPEGKQIAGHTFDRGTAQGSPVQVEVHHKGFYSVFVRAANTPAQNKAPSYKLSVTYTAPQTL